ncbi:DUF1573 domain-containing protein [Thermoflexibacter ruber]|uniref:DUF1573 domain-containing protein n=2 Tax=Thermoflexibacter ruber TaxID=1003 RepID=A0A1I2FY14_9BACT|nr:DUF1573 domain-containing protein [Thermoflexibacter ruber]SFF09590.1 Protein of unknown function [Thermoflexibacter ruber]
MNKKLSNIIFYIVVFLLIGFAISNFLFANQPKPLTAIQASTNYIQIDNIRLGQVKDTIIYLKNIGNEALQLDTIGTDCGCTVAKWHKNAVKVGEQTPITVRFEAKEEGIVLKKLQIYANIEPNPFTINLKAMVKRKE